MTFQYSTDCTELFAEDLHRALLDAHKAAAALCRQWDEASMPATGDHALVDLRLCLLLGEAILRTVAIHDQWQEERQRTAPTAAYGMRRAEA